MWVVLAVAVLIFLFMIKYEYKRDVNRKHDRKSIKRFRRKRLGASIAYANTTRANALFTGYFKRIKDS
jgi:hypothetical protein